MMSQVGKERVCDVLQCNGPFLHPGESTTMEVEWGRYKIDQNDFAHFTSQSDNDMQPSTVMVLVERGSM